MGISWSIEDYINIMKYKVQPIKFGQHAKPKTTFNDYSLSIVNLFCRSGGQEETSRRQMFGVSMVLDGKKVYTCAPRRQAVYHHISSKG